MRRSWLVTIAVFLMAAALAWASDPEKKVLIRDLASVAGVRDNPLVGYGLVVGLNGTGDRRQTMFTIQTLANALQRMGVQIPTGTARVNNVAAVFVTAALPAFARPGTRIDITVSSIGDAKSLDGGLLLLSPLYGADGQVYAAAQGPITLGGYSAGTTGNAKQVNHPTVGRIPGGGLVERDAAVDLRSLPKLSLLLRESNFQAAYEVSSAINQDFGKPLAVAVDGSRVDVSWDGAPASNMTALVARIESLLVTIHPRARVVVNERTGTVVMGRDVRLGAVSILHGGLSIEVATEFTISQPAPLSKGETALVPQPNVRAEEKAARRIELTEGASVDQLVNGLQTMGATARDVIAILQAIKSAGALDADLEVI
ncbi:MAG: flagellar biosynthesis protein FlgA [Acidobacteria bacterium]|nr:MAG: flagellar biosynthesis protein FlgA [Acidobacteriota bacterium]